MSIQSASRLFFILCALAVTPFALCGCDSLNLYTDDDQDILTDNPPPENVQEDPPRDQAEIVPFIQNPQAEIWRPGYWAMSYGKFVWIHGKVIARPSPTAVWNGAHWVHHTFGWSFEEGHWE